MRDESRPSTHADGYAIGGRIGGIGASHPSRSSGGAIGGASMPTGAVTAATALPGVVALT